MRDEAAEILARPFEPELRRARLLDIGGGAAWYFKIYRPKHQQADQPEEDDGGEYPDYDEFEDDGPPWDEEDETEEKEEIR